MNYKPKVIRRVLRDWAKHPNLKQNYDVGRVLATLDPTYVAVLVAWAHGQWSAEDIGDLMEAAPVFWHLWTRSVVSDDVAPLRRVERRAAA